MKRIISWIVILCILGGFTYWDYIEQNAPKDEEKTQISIYTDVEGYEKKIQEHFEDKMKLRKQYNLVFQNTHTSQNADAILSDDYNKIDPSRDYEVIAYAPLVVVMKITDRLEKYDERELLIIDKNGHAEINFKQLIEAVINGENWSCFGGEDKPIRVYCPIASSSDGKLFYRFLLISINNGKYPKGEEEIKRCEQIADEFLASGNVRQLDMVERISKIRDIGDDVYVMPENDFYKCFYEISVKKLFFVAYPTETVIKQIYYQINTPVGQEFNQLFNKIQRLRTKEYYRTKKSPNTYDSNRTNTKNAFNYVEIPKDSWT